MRYGECPSEGARERMARALLLHPYRATVRASSSSEYDVVPEIKLSDPTRNYRVLVLGGTGRVGGSTAVALSKLCPKLRIVVGGRNRLARYVLTSF